MLPFFNYFQSRSSKQPAKIIPLHCKPPRRAHEVPTLPSLGEGTPNLSWSCRKAGGAGSSAPLSPTSGAAGGPAVLSRRSSRETREPLITTLRWLPIVLSGLSGACQDIIRPLELNWKNVGELCNYNHDLCSGLQRCGAKAKQGEGRSKGKGWQKGALFTSNSVSSTTSLGLKQEKSMK